MNSLLKMKHLLTHTLTWLIQLVHKIYQDGGEVYINGFTTPTAHIAAPGKCWVLVSSQTGGKANTAQRLIQKTT